MQVNLQKKLEFDKIVMMLLEECESLAGKNFCENLKPSFDTKKVKELLDETTEAKKLINLKGSFSMSSVRETVSFLQKANKGAVLNEQSILDIASNLDVSFRLKRYFNSSENLALSNLERDNSDFPILSKIFDDLYVNNNLYVKITSAIMPGGIVCDTASQNLYNIRKRIETLESQIKSKLNNLIHGSSFKKYLQDSVISIRDDRYVIPVKQEYRGKIQGLVHDTSTSGSTLFIEPMFVVEINNRIREEKNNERVEIEKILKDLTSLIVSCVDNLCHLEWNLSKLDFIFAKAKLSFSMNANEPLLNDNGYINLKNARHPLIDKNLVVPINIWCGKDFNTLVITGPNTGGKTVTLKTVGLFAMMCQSGLHIPVDFGSSISVYSNIFADIGDEQSIEQNLSTFSAHILNVINILKTFRPNALILLDELGSGTDPVEGSAIAMAILEFLHNKSAITIATTHYSEIKLFALKTKGIENACTVFDVATLKPTYELLIGIPGKSNAFAISKRLGMDLELLDRAKSFVNKGSVEFEDILATAHYNKIETQRSLEKAVKDKKEIEKLKIELEKEKYDLELKKLEILNNAKLKAKTILDDAKEEAKESLKEIRDLIKEKELASFDKKAEKVRNNLKNGQDKVNSVETNKVVVNKNFDFSLGQTVKILSLNQTGTIVGLDESKQNIQIQVGSMKINVPKNQLVPSLEKIEPERNNVKVFKNVSMKDKQILSSIDVHGQTVEEAITTIDKYLDDAVLAGFKNVTLIHGKGTGALRKGIQQFLKNHPHVNSFRRGVYGEGEEGVTIVELK